MNIFLKSFISLFLVSVFISFFVTSTSLADNYQLDTFAGKAGYSLTGTGASVESTVQLVINVVLSLTGILFLILAIYAGIRWMTAKGNEEMVTTARNTLEAAVIGMVIISVSYAITTLIFNSLPSNISNNPVVAPSTTPICSDQSANCGGDCTKKCSENASCGIDTDCVSLNCFQNKCYIDCTQFKDPNSCLDNQAKGCKWEGYGGAPLTCH